MGVGPQMGITRARFWCLIFCSVVFALLVLVRHLSYLSRISCRSEWGDHKSNAQECWVPKWWGTGPVWTVEDTQRHRVTLIADCFISLAVIGVQEKF